MNLETLRASVTALRAFVPTADIAASIAFYEALGFITNRLGPDLAEMRIGENSFLLQNYGSEASAENFVMHLMVDDVDAWWAHIESLDVEKTFGITWQPRPPVLQTWGLRVAFIVDPAGVLWHIAQRAA